MEITEVRIKLMENTDDRLRAFCSITFDHCFAVRDLKIIDGTSGPFVAMPSRKLTVHCLRCGYKNHIKASFCNQCGERQREDRALRDADGRSKLYADIAHPINTGCREMIQSRVIAEFHAELERSQQPGYASRYDDDYGYEDIDPHEPSAAPVPAEPSGSAEATKAQVVPPPHLPTGAGGVDAGSRTRAEESSGPHFKPRASESAEPKENKSSASEKRGDFGAGIMD